jgi:protein-S-isoprenylcysteine O-methyltransferase Ste14
LALRLIPESLLINMAGVSISILGTAFAVWARILLGSNWSAKVAIKEGQRLIQNGPYAVVRNPIYSGALFFMIGAALVSGQVRGLVGLGLVLIYAWLKGKTEERFLSEEFGEEYREYQKRVKFMIPFII